MSKLSYSDVSAKPQGFMALTSLTLAEFELLVTAFEKAFQEHMSQWRLDGQARTKRRYTTYRNCPLPTTEERLLFVLSYVKSNPLQSNHGMLFGMSQGKPTFGYMSCCPCCGLPCASWRWRPTGACLNWLLAWVYPCLRKVRRLPHSPFLS